VIVNLAGAFIVGVIQQVGTATLLVLDTTRLFLTTGMIGRSHDLLDVQRRDRSPHGGERLASGLASASPSWGSESADCS
jgi:hypothetical protein